MVLKEGGEEYILQQINNNVFKHPYAISDNIRLAGDYLQRHFPDYFFYPIHAADGHDLVYNSDGYFRVFPFVKNSVTYTTVEDPDLAFEAARPRSDRLVKFSPHLQMASF